MFTILFTYEIYKPSQTAILHSILVCFWIQIFFPKSKNTHSEILTFFNLKIVLQKSLSKESL